MYTTKLLLDIMDDVMPRRQRMALAGVVAFLVVMSIAGSLSSRPAPTVVQAPPIVVIATPTLARAVGLVKQAAPLAAPARSAPTAAPLVVPVMSAPANQTDERPSDKPAPPRSHERTTDKAGPGK